MNNNANRVDHVPTPSQEADEGCTSTGAIWLDELNGLLVRHSRLGIGGDVRAMDQGELTALHHFLRRLADAEHATTVDEPDFYQPFPELAVPVPIGTHVGTPSRNASAEKIMFEYDPKDAPATYGAISRRPGEVHYAYGGHPFTNPEEACIKILDWFERNPVLSDEQALYELHIPNFRDRISDLRKRGYRIHGLGCLMNGTPRRLFHSMNYALHHAIPRYVDLSSLPNYGKDERVVATVKTVLVRYMGFTHIDVESMSFTDFWILRFLIKKMQPK